MKIPIIVLGIFVLLGCSNPPDFDRDAFLQRPERKLLTYTGVIEPEIMQRIRPAPEAILAYLNAMDQTDRYGAYMPSEAEKAMFSEYLGLLPGMFRDLIQQKVVGIYFVSNFVGGGMSDFLYDEKGNMYSALYLNPVLFQKSLAEWIEFRENSSFLEDPRISIKVSSATQYRGLLHTLIHEASHLYDYYHHATPYIESFFKEEARSSTTEFTEGVWDDHRKPKATFDVLQHSGYSGWGLNGRIEKDKAARLYGRLVDSPFASLYGTLSWSEDFAECFTWYYLKKKLGVTYRVSVQENGKTLVDFEPRSDKLQRVTIFQL